MCDSEGWGSADELGHGLGDGEIGEAEMLGTMGTATVGSRGMMAVQVFVEEGVLLSSLVVFKEEGFEVLD